MWVSFLGFDQFYVGVQAFIYGVLITYATTLASASISASLFLGLVNIPGTHA